MTPKRAYFVMVGVLVLLVAAIFAGAYGANILLQSESSHLVNLKAKLAALNQQQTNLTTAKKEIASDSPLASIAETVVPQSKDQAEAVRQIVKLAGDNNINLASITFPNSSLGGTGTGVASSSASSNPALSQLVTVPGIAGVYQLEITVTSSTQNGQLATYPQLISFLSALENNRLTALVNGLDIEPNTNDHSLFSFTLNMAIYIKPGS